MMNRVSRPALRGSLLGNVLRLLNPIVKFLLNSPIHWPLSHWFAILSWTGRKTGKRYSTPVSHIREGEVVWITTGDRWWRNLGDRGPVTIRVRGQWREAVAAPITDPAESQTGHERLFRAHPWFRWLSGIPESSAGGADPVELGRALQAGRVLVRIELGDHRAGARHLDAGHAGRKHRA
jgi:deazaflavin-dependent oxidoreductase (nitroreductase family)